MEYQTFFDEVESIVLYDDLAKFLGVNKDGIIEMTYLDVVKTAGHSCATVAGAWLMALKGLKALFGDEIPQRGKIKVELSKAPVEDNMGVVGCVFSNITGATTNYGFGGIVGGKFNRRNLLFYNVSMNTLVRFTRMDTGKQIGINYHPGKVVNPKEILKSALGPDATEENKRTLPERFQAMVKKVLDNADIVIEIVNLT